MANLAKHGIAFECATRVFLDLFRLEQDDLIGYEGEVRRRLLVRSTITYYWSSTLRALHELESSLPGGRQVMGEENITKFKLDESNLPRLSKASAKRLYSMSDENIE